MAETRERRCNSFTVNLLIISSDCDPKAELPFPCDPPLIWNTVVDALSNAKYWFAMYPLPPPPLDRCTSNHSKTGRSGKTGVAFLSLQASKKVAFFHGDVVVEAKYEPTYDEENLMNDLPSYGNLKGLPSFHPFMSLPEDLQLRVVELLDGVGFARMRCVCRHFSRLEWSRSFNILKYSHPNQVNRRRAEPKLEERSGGGFLGNAFLQFAYYFCLLAVSSSFYREVRFDYGEEDQ
ncbi:UNVERIFIED_CONTAM: hypothetical protein Sindi_1195400 [Sesamum indicum]